MGGSIAQEGRVEVCVDGVWGSVCGNGWTKQTAFMVCKQAGFDSGMLYSGNKLVFCFYVPIIILEL